jgi:hypothetical protein
MHTEMHAVSARSKRTKPVMHETAELTGGARGSGLVVHEAAELVVHEAAELVVHEAAELAVHEAAELVVHEATELVVHGAAGSNHIVGPITDEQQHATAKQGDLLTQLTQQLLHKE